MAGTSAGMGPLISAWITTVFPSAGIISITFTRKFGTAFGNTRQTRSMPPRIGTTLSRPYGAYRPIAPSAQRASMPSTSWASYAVKNFSAIGRNFALFPRNGGNKFFNAEAGRRNKTDFRVRGALKPALTEVVADPQKSTPPK